MAKEQPIIGFTCPKCGLTKTGYRKERHANDDLQVHMYRKHRPPAPPKQEIRLLKY